MRLRLCFSAKAVICGPTMTVPSSLASSQMTATGGRFGEPAQVDRGLGVARAHQHAALLGDQRKDVAGADEIARAHVVVGERAHRVAALLGRDAGGHARASRRPRR